MRVLPSVVSVLTFVLAMPALAQLGDARMQRANAAASAVVRERMAQERPLDAKLLDQVSSSDIVVVRGEYDRVEDVLRSLGIAHTVVDPSQVAGLKLNTKQLLIVNCPGTLTKAGVERVRRFGDGQVLHSASHFYLQQNQTRTVAEAKKGKDFLASDADLSPSTKEALQKSGRVSDDVIAGDLSSAYSAQQMTSNIVVEQKRTQARIDSLYDLSLKMPVPTAAPARPGEDAPSLRAGTRLKQLERHGDRVKVRTMEGDEAWVPASAL